MKSTIVATALLGLSMTTADAGFVGTLAFRPTGCEASGRCKLVYDFGYIDPNGVGWQAKAGLETDGASIPGWAQPIIGGAWDKEFIRAAVIHDWYCDRTVRTRSQTHRMFYNALIESKVDGLKALAMYYAVVVGSHMWVDLMEGQPCAGVKNCIQSVGGGLSIPNAVVKKNDDGKLVAYRSPRFDDPKIRKDIEDVQGLIASGAVKSPDEVDALAQTRHLDDFFLTHGDTVIYQGPSSQYPDR